MEIYPSLISSDLLNLGHTVQQFDHHCDGYHLDIMDDHFVPNLTWGPAFINALRKASRLPFHVHLMVANPGSWIDRLELRTGDTCIFHYEALKSNNDCRALINAVHGNGWHAGVAINPQTAVEKIFWLLELVDTILLMSVNPGFSAQQFMPDVTKKIAPLLAMQQQMNRLFKIGMDGGINEQNIGLLAKQKIDFVGIAWAIFGQPNPIHALQNLYTLAK